MMIKQISIITGFMVCAGISQISGAQEGNELKLPDDLTIEAQQSENFELRETRVGHRLDRVTVQWQNGITEVYQNQRNDTIWSAEEDQLGDTPNVRQWRLGSW